MVGDHSGEPSFEYPEDVEQRFDLVQVRHRCCEHRAQRISDLSGPLLLVAHDDHLVGFSLGTFELRKRVEGVAPDHCECGERGEGDIGQDLFHLARKACYLNKYTEFFPYGVDFDYFCPRMRLKPPKIVRRLMPDLIWEIDDPDGVFLTFDDGPTPGVTEWILSTLDKYDAKATFFVLGKNVEMYPDLYQRIVDAGHKIGNHTYSHQKGWGMSLERYTEDVDFANDLLHTELFRPPYARITPAQARFLGQRYKLVMWDIISRDYNRQLSPRTCLKNVTKYLAPGAIVVFHDSEKAFRNMRYALPRTLEKIRQMGLRCKAIEL